MPLPQLRNMIQDVVRTLTFMYSSLDRWVLSEGFSFQSLIFHWCSLEKTNCRINFNVSREFLCMFLYTCMKTRIALFLPFDFNLNTSKTVFKQSLSLQEVLSLIRLNHSHNPSHCGCQQHSVSIKHRCVSVLHFEQSKHSGLLQNEYLECQTPFGRVIVFLCFRKSPRFSVWLLN